MAKPPTIQVGGAFMKNKYEIRGDITAIFLNHKGGVVETLIETADLSTVSTYPGTWYLSGCGYVCGQVKITPGRKGKRRVIRLHRLVMNAPEGLEVDHINRDRLDNRRSNLRLVTLQENLKNKSVYKNNKVGKTGVSFKKDVEKWRAYRYENGKQIHLGYFDTVEEAISAMESSQ